MVTIVRADLATVTDELGKIPDPEIPVITLAELGILRRVEMIDERIHVTLTPTYSGCPATEAIRDDVQRVLEALGHQDALVQLTLTPAWTTDWMLPGTHEKLRAYGIAPPGERCGTSESKVLNFVPKDELAGPACPQCSSPNVSLLSEFGSTPCKSLYRCLTCSEPFDYFKPF